MASRNKVMKLFVANLPWTVSNTELLQYFAQFGPVVSAKVIFDGQSGLSKKYGFVAFQSNDGFQSALGKPSHELEGHTITVKSVVD